MDEAAATARSTAPAEGRASRSGWRRLAHLLCLIYAGFVLVQNIGQITYYWPGAGPLHGGSIGMGVGDVAAGDGFEVAETVTAGGPMASAGVAQGDLVRFDKRYDAHRRLAVGEGVGFTVNHKGQLAHHTVVAEPRIAPPADGLSWLSLLYELATVTAAVFGAFIIWRSRGNPTTLLLGMGLLTYGLIAPWPQLWLSGRAVYPFAFAIGYANLMAISTLFYAFAIRFYEDWVGPLRRFEKLAFWAYALAAAAVGIAESLAVFNSERLAILDHDALTRSGIFYLGFALALGYLVLGWRRSNAATQQRYALLLVATSAIILAQVLDITVSPQATGALLVAHLVGNALLTGVIASGLFAYSILRHRVFDLGFAVNRTLVYAVVSAILLTAFGLIEWAVEHFVPIEGREKNALVDAAIAVGVFLTFHRVRDIVEHGIEGLFFRRWQKAEARLRRFVREAAFITDASILTRALAKALGEFGEGAAVAIYLGEDGGYRRAVGEVAGLGEMLDTNLPTIVALRAEPRAFETHDESDAPANLIAPMINRAEVVGLAILGPKTSGLAYRPDEIELIGWATRQVGLDLHALEVDRYSALAAELRHENTTLRSLIARHA